MKNIISMYARVRTYQEHCVTPIDFSRLNETAGILAAAKRNKQISFPDAVGTAGPRNRSHAHNNNAHLYLRRTEP